MCPAKVTAHVLVNEVIVKPVRPERIARSYTSHAEMNVSQPVKRRGGRRKFKISLQTTAGQCDPLEYEGYDQLRQDGMEPRKVRDEMRTRLLDIRH